MELAYEAGYVVPVKRAEHLVDPAIDGVVPG
jgi:hypothetical protein